MSKTYLVAFKKGLDDVSEDYLTDNGCEIITRYEHLPTVFIIKTNSIDKIKSKVEYTEQDTSDVTTLASPDWYKHRLVTPFLPVRRDYDPLYTGKGVNIYIMDDGFSLSGNLFSGDKSDSVGHGDHMAYLAKQVAPDATLKLLDIANDSGVVNIHNLVSQFDKILGDAKKSENVSIVNMSWGIPRNSTLDLILSVVFDSDKLIGVCAAGNDGTPIDSITPAGNPFVYTVGASDKYDRVLEYTDNDTFYKPVGSESLNFFAPGVGVEVATGGIETTITGTSVSSVISAAAIAHYAQIHKTKEETLDNFEGSLLTDVLYIHSSVGEALNKLVYIPNKFNYTVWGTESGLLGELSSGSGVVEFALELVPGTTITESDYSALPENVTLDGNVIKVDTDNFYEPGLYNIALIATKDGHEYTRSFTYTIDQDASTESPVEFFYDKTGDEPVYVKSQIVTYLIMFFKD